MLHLGYYFLRVRDGGPMCLRRSPRQHTEAGLPSESRQTTASHLLESTNDLLRANTPCQEVNGQEVKKYELHPGTHSNIY